MEWCFCTFQWLDKYELNKYANYMKDITADSLDEAMDGFKPRRRSMTLDGLGQIIIDRVSFSYFAKMLFIF